MTNETTETNENTEANDPVELTIQDLATIRSIIDAASQRGAFKTNEMVTVGTAYNKLDAFLNAVAERQNEAKDAEEAVAEEAKGE